MKIERRIKVPTGDILIVEGEKGQLECLSLGDYGKDINLKADFMGLNRKIEKVEHTELLPLEKKWVCTISTQYGCSMNCKFCDVPKVGPGKNATEADLINQVATVVNLHPEVTHTDRLNIHFARMGEPTWNPNVLSATRGLINYNKRGYRIHPVVSTMMPKRNAWLKHFIREWMEIKNYELNGEAGLQISINSTNEQIRNWMFSNNCCSLNEISSIISRTEVNGRKITINFAVADYEIDGKVLRSYFDPEYFLCKLTPMHKTSTAQDNHLLTPGDYTQYYPYEEIEKNLKEYGYDVLVFIASEKEDLGRITCGNAILSGTLPECDYTEE